MASPAFDPASPGARLLVRTARQVLDLQRSVAVIVHAPIVGRFEPGEPRSLKSGDHTEIPIAWARSLVERGLVSYED